MVKEQILEIRCRQLDKLWVRFISQMSLRSVPIATPISEAGKGLLSCGGEVIGAGSETSCAIACYKNKTSCVCVRSGSTRLSEKRNLVSEYLETENLRGPYIRTVEEGKHRLLVIAESAAAECFLSDLSPIPQEVEMFQEPGFHH